MRIVLVHPLGFCCGVKRAITIVKNALKKKADYYSLGPIIHNSYVIEQLSKKGLKPLPFYQDKIFQSKKGRGKLANDLNLLPPNSILFLPTHGTSPKLIRRLRKNRINFTDLVCPYVSQVQKICQDLRNKGFKVVIIGDKDHREVRVLNEIVKDAIIIDRKADLLDNNFLQGTKRVGIISQTTKSKDKYLQIVSNLIKKYTCLPKGESGIKEFYLFNTICPDSLKRQERLKRITKRVDLMIIVGGKDSANTKSLYRIAKKIRKRSYHIENQKDLNRLRILSFGRKTIGIASGSSTPEILVKKVIGGLKEWKRI